MFHCLHTGKDHSHLCLKKGWKQFWMVQWTLLRTTAPRKYNWWLMNSRFVWKTCLRAYWWCNSFLQIQARKRTCTCSLRQYMFHCFHTGWDNSHQYLMKYKMHTNYAIAPYIQCKYLNKQKIINKKNKTTKIPLPWVNFLFKVVKREKEVWTCQRKYNGNCFFFLFL